MAEALRSQQSQPFALTQLELVASKPARPKKLRELACGLVIDYANSEVSFGKPPVLATANRQHFEILYLLTSEPERVYTRDEVREQTGIKRFKSGSNLLARYVRDIRLALYEVDCHLNPPRYVSAGMPFYNQLSDTAISTVQGVGYILSPWVLQPLPVLEVPTLAVQMHSTPQV